MSTIKYLPIVRNITVYKRIRGRVPRIKGYMISPAKRQQSFKSERFTITMKPLKSGLAWSPLDIFNHDIVLPGEYVKMADDLILKQFGLQHLAEEFSQLRRAAVWNPL